MRKFIIVTMRHFILFSYLGSGVVTKSPRLQNPTHHRYHTNRALAFHKLLSYLYKSSHPVGKDSYEKSKYFRWDSSKEALSDEHSAWKLEVDG